MEYKLIMRILESKNNISFEELQKKADVLYLAKKLTDEQYETIVTKIMAKGGE